MQERKRRMATLWEVPDDLWNRIEIVLVKHDPPKHTGRQRTDLRRVLDGIIFRLRTGCQWNHIPSVYGNNRTIHRWFQHWCAMGMFEKIWALIVDECEELKGVQWAWQAADTAVGKARFGGARLDPTPRIVGKMGRNAVS